MGREQVLRCFLASRGCGASSRAGRGLGDEQGGGLGAEQGSRRDGAVAGAVSSRINLLLPHIYKALYGYEPNLVASPRPTADTPQEVTEVITHREENLKEQAQNRMKVQADKHRSDRQFVVGN